MAVSVVTQIRWGRKWVHLV